MREPIGGPVQLLIGEVPIGSLDGNVIGVGVDLSLETTGDRLLDLALQKGTLSRHGTERTETSGRNAAFAMPAG